MIGADPSDRKAAEARPSARDTPHMTPSGAWCSRMNDTDKLRPVRRTHTVLAFVFLIFGFLLGIEIGRASCRERV